MGVCLWCPWINQLIAAQPQNVLFQRISQLEQTPFAIDTAACLFCRAAEPSKHLLSASPLELALQHSEAESFIWLRGLGFRCLGGHPTQ